MKTKEDFEQMALDTRPELDRAIGTVTADAISTALALVERHYEIAAEREGSSYTGPVRNRHEAYGIAAEQHSRILKSVNTIKAGVITLLGTLSDPNYNAIDATSSIVNSITDATGVLIRAAAEMKRTLDDLYTAETNAALPGKTPMEALADGDGFQEAEDLAPEDPDIDHDADPDAEDGENGMEDE